MGSHELSCSVKGKEFVNTTSRHQLERRPFFATILHAVVHSSTHKSHME